MATINGTRVLGMEESISRLEVENTADFVVVNLGSLTALRGIRSSLEILEVVWILLLCLLIAALGKIWS